ncbi:iron-containing alcohol dehydrogenase [Xinfangfangia sp. D13-10-4-6]|uniref:iron-containing alcohol dehydrogenase n=1 Tax=Pseudogemmobacter hezensis TaxID=2737662 RepID=UPI0015552DFF|nr:iron-containing alcohol dehydrogenase [Pseudogemmobacter hezensis]NPD15944.1 iron-containing alcohol dehydrogenase [Pseudogemmobacter hezensis]
MQYQIEAPQRILFGRGQAARAPALIRAFGPRGLIVHGANPARAAWLISALQGCELATQAIGSEPTLADLTAALDAARPHRPDWVAAIGGGAALDLGKALAALIPAPACPMDHLEVVGRGLPLTAAPLPFIALPTTAGTGAEVTKNAVIGVPDHGRKVSLRDPAMLARVAIIDPALTDFCPREVTLTSGLDAITQVIEPFLSSKATPYTDAITRPALALGLPALMQLMKGEDANARDTIAHVSLTGGLALANGGLGAVHGLAGVIGGRLNAPHGAICGALLGPTLRANATATGGTPFAPRMTEALNALAPALGCTAKDTPEALSQWAHSAGLPRLNSFGLSADQIPDIAAASAASSSMKGNPVPLPPQILETILRAAL